MKTLALALVLVSCAALAGEAPKALEAPPVVLPSIVQNSMEDWAAYIHDQRHIADDLSALLNEVKRLTEENKKLYDEVEKFKPKK